jgi:type VI secretion system protein ImpH
LGGPALRGRDEIDDRAKLYFSGRLAAHAKNAEGLAAIVTEYFGIEARVECFSGEWIKVPAADACRLGESTATGLLGSSIIVGSSVWQCQTKFRLRLGPMTLLDLYRLLPRQPAFTRLKTWVLNYVGEELRWDAQYVLLAREVPQTQLGSGGLLGWTTWITTRKPDRDVEDVIIDPALN